MSRRLKFNSRKTQEYSVIRRNRDPPGVITNYTEHGHTCVARHKETCRHTFTRLHLYREADLQPFRTMDSNRMVPRVNSCWNPCHQQSNSCWHPVMSLSLGGGNSHTLCLFSLKLRHMKSILDTTSFALLLICNISDGLVSACFQVSHTQHVVIVRIYNLVHARGMICGMPLATMSRHSTYSKQCETSNWYENGKWQ